MEEFLKNYLEPLSLYFNAVTLFLASLITRENRHRLLSVYYVIAGTEMYYAIILSYNAWLYNLYFLINIIVVSVYFRSLYNSKNYKRLTDILMIIAVLLFFYFIHSFVSFDQDVKNDLFSIYSLIGIVYTLLYYYQLVKKVSDENILYNFNFWITNAYILYFLGSFFVIVYFKDNEKALSKEQLSVYRAMMWSIQNAVLFISSVITFAGYLKISYRKKS